MARSRPPTDEQKTEIYDSKNPASRPKSATKKGFESGELALPEAGKPVEIGTPTEITPRDRSEPIRMISMKSPAEIGQDKRVGKQHKAEIRAISDVVRRHDTPAGGMGYFAPPADRRQARGRRVRDLILWGSILVVISCAVMLAVWFLAGRR